MIKWNKKTKGIAVVVTSVLLLTLVVGVTLALLRAKSEPAANTFEGGMVNIEVIENGEQKDGGSTVDYQLDGNGSVAKNVTLKNVKSESFPTADTYVRARLVPVFRYISGDHQGEVYPGDASVIKYSGTSVKWKQKIQGGETYYYYQDKVKPDTETESLITTVSYEPNGVVIPDDVVIEIQVLAEGISARQKTDSGEVAANKVWGVDFYK